jgi:hypothetical protein
LAPPRIEDIQINKSATTFKAATAKHNKVKDGLPERPTEERDNWGIQMQIALCHALLRSARAPAGHQLWDRRPFNAGICTSPLLLSLGNGQ